jgi:hypothetical protein
VPVPEIGVHLARLRSEVWNGVQPPPFLREVGEALAARVKLAELTGSFPPPNLGVERLGVAFRLKDL